MSRATAHSPKHLLAGTRNSDLPLLSSAGKVAAGGNRTETRGPFGNLYLAIAKGCELLKAYPTAAVSIDDGAGILIFDEESLRENCQSK